MLKKPKNFKFTKAHKGRLNYSFNHSQNFIHAPYALISLDAARLTAAQIAAAELAIKRVIRRDGTLYTRVFPHIPVTKKPLEVRMGKGKGSVSF
jgi:large subunit ribosomal protein L16